MQTPERTKVLGKLGRCDALHGVTPPYSALTRKDSRVSANVNQEFVAVEDVYH